MGDFLTLGSVVAFSLRVLSVVLLLWVLWKQFAIFHRPNTYKSENKLKLLLSGLVVFTLLSNLPIMLLNLQRAEHVTTSSDVTAIATIFNAFSILAIAVILLIIYSDKDGQDGY